MDERPSWLATVVEGFLKGNLALLLILISLAAGAAALYLTPREEEPQIVVPVADVLVQYPGGSAEEVERLVAARLERLLAQIDGVEYVYSMSRPGLAVVTVRFFVGQDREDSLIKLYNKIFQNIDKTTPGIAGWVVKPVEIDDVPIVTLALHSEEADTHALYRIAEEVAGKLQHIRDGAAITIHGGERRELRVDLDSDRVAAYGLSPLEIAGALQLSNAEAESGSFAQTDRQIRVLTGPFLKSAEEVRNLLVGVHGGKPVYLRDVAAVRDGPAEVRTYSRLGFGPAAADGRGGRAARPAVTIAVAKKKGSNAVWVAREVEATLAGLKGSLIPDNVDYTITRDYGATANEKVNSLVHGLAEAVVTVIGLIALAMSWRVGLIVALAVPITYALTLLVNLLLGYTINRVTLFALILALGLLVDDPIVGVENIYRHLALRRKPRHEAILDAMNEVLPPIVLATLSVIAAFLPLFFITGMMGPYMRPLAVNVPLAMLSSMVVAVTITPWVAGRLLKETGTGEAEAEDPTRTAVGRLYARAVRPFIESRRRAWALLLATGALFAGSVALAFLAVPLKMLPFDNRNELQIVVDMPEGTTLERTDAAVRRLEDYLAGVPETANFSSIVGAASPMDFNGLVRHYYLRQGPHLADVRVNLADKKRRRMNSHAIALRLRRDLAALERECGASFKLVETPPGPPVLATLVAEIYGRPQQRYEELAAAAQTVKARLAQEPGVVDVDDSVEADQEELYFRVDREKAALNGIAVADVVQTAQMLLNGIPAGTVHVATEQNELPIVVRLPRERRSDAERLKTVLVRGRTGDRVPLGELAHSERRSAERTIYHKNQERVVYVTAEVAGRGPAYAVLALQSWFRRHPLPDGLRVDWRGEGEWKITLDVFRDLGLAFGAALIVIYALLVYETASYALPAVIMLSIPLTLIGIMPGFWLLNALANRPVGGFANPVFFTATAMIGMIALAGIVVRNGILLIDFIRTGAARGMPLAEAVLAAGAVRFRPIFLTAGTTLLGAWPITLDPIFSGLAWSLIFGLFVSTAFTLVVIPIVYLLIYGGRVSARR